MRLLYPCLGLAVATTAIAQQCLQARPELSAEGSLPPSAVSLVGLCRPHVPNVCESLTPNETTDATITLVSIQGYQLFRVVTFPGFLIVGDEQSACADAFNLILDNCVTNQTFYGGATISNYTGIYYNLTNSVAPLTPVFFPDDNSTEPSANTSITVVTVLPTLPPASATVSTPANSTVTTSTSSPAGPVATAAEISAAVAAAAAAAAALQSAPADPALIAAAAAAANAALDTAAAFYVATAGGPFFAALQALVTSLQSASAAALSATAFPGVATAAALATSLGVAQAAAVGAADAAQQESQGHSMTSISSSSSSSSSTSATPTPSSYLLTTKPGTSLLEYWLLISNLPDGGRGENIVFPYLPSQAYVTTLNETDAAELAENSIIETLEVTDDSDDFSANVPRGNGEARRLSKRVAPPPRNINQQIRSPKHLKVISQGETTDLEGAKLDDDRFDYKYDPRAGSGVTIYVLDTGILEDSLDFRPGSIKGKHFVPNMLLKKDEPLNIDDEFNHGTCVASVALGKEAGVAKQADLVVVKYGGRKGARTPQIEGAWRWAVSDVIRRGIKGKAVINFSAGVEPSAQKVRMLKKEFSNLLKLCWDNDIVTVVAAGNEGQATKGGTTLADFLPTMLGTKSNALITVGGLLLSGAIYEHTTRESRRGGSMTVWAQAAAECASHENPYRYQRITGTSFAAPAVAGLAAYFLSLPEYESRLRPPGTAKKVKDLIVEKSYHRYRSPAKVKAIYNGAEEGLCNLVPADMRGLRKEKRQEEALSFAEIPIVVSGTVVDPRFTLPLCPLIPSSTRGPEESTKTSLSPTSRNPTTSIDSTSLPETASSQSSTLEATLTTETSSSASSTTTQSVETISPTTSQPPETVSLTTSESSSPTEKSSTSDATESLSSDAPTTIVTVTSDISSTSEVPSTSDTSPTLPSGTTTCDQQRPAGAPSGGQVANALTYGEQVATICATTFSGSGDVLHTSFSHGYLIISLERGYDTEQLTYCVEGLNAIIDGCIRYGGDYGGTYTRGDQLFTIKNIIFKANPLNEGEDGGPLASTTAVPPPPSPTVPPAQTVTLNCQVCVLRHGSLNPVCTPLDGCTPTTPPTSTPTLAPLGNVQPSCDRKSLTLPNTWILADGRHTAREIMYRMRDQACQGLCGALSGIKSDLMAAVRIGESGCEFSIKVGNLVEMYLYSTGMAQNCYDATALIIDECPTTNGQQGWINGPNFGEFYQVGVRPMNGAGSVHAPFPSNTHLGFNQVHCYSILETALGFPLFYRFYIDTVNWEDGRFGQSLLDNANGCGVTTAWNWQARKPGEGYDFGGGFRADQYGGFTLPVFVGSKCGEHAIETALDLPYGSVDCTGRVNFCNLLDPTCLE